MNNFQIETVFEIEQDCNYLLASFFSRASKCKNVCDSEKIMEPFLYLTKESAKFNENLTEYEMANIISTEINFIRKRNMVTFRHSFTIKDILKRNINHRPSKIWIQAIDVNKGINKMITKISAARTPSSII